MTPGAVLGTLLDMGLRPPPLFDPTTATSGWAASLRQFSPEVLAAVVAQFSSSERWALPSLPEVIARCHAEARARQAPAKAAKQAACPECEGQTWVTLSAPGDTLTVRPCSECRPEPWKRWRAHAFSDRWSAPLADSTPVEDDAARDAIPQLRAFLASVVLPETPHGTKTATEAGAGVDDRPRGSDAKQVPSGAPDLDEDF